MKIVPPLDPGFTPAVLWNRAYRALVESDPGARRVHLALERPDGTVFRHAFSLLAQNHPEAHRTPRFVERPPVAVPPGS